MFSDINHISENGYLLRFALSKYFAKKSGENHAKSGNKYCEMLSILIEIGDVAVKKLQLRFSILSISKKTQPNSLVP